MLFNSTEFILGFLPLTLVAFFLLGRASRNLALGSLILASLIFYAWWRPFNVVLIAPSIIVNFTLARMMERLDQDERRALLRKSILVVGIVFNIAFLGYFKYINFLRGTINDVFSANLVLSEIILPLGISFITFQKIAFLVDVYAKRVKMFTLQDYALFVLFFPQLIAGPIVHFREVMPQFHAAPCRFEARNISVGLTLLVFGLFKKVVIADRIAPLVSPVFDQAAELGGASFLLSWMAAIGFTLQIYFDFSGYSDMALGLARLFGIVLPQNFNSPLKASSIIEFWSRWHMTLTRFLTAYIYNPLVLSLSRRRAAKVVAGTAATAGKLESFLHFLVFPTITTMLVAGIWHGAGYTFIVWGLLHGAYLAINHGWRLVRPMVWRDRASYERWMRPIGWVLTFVAVVIAMVWFRSSSCAVALDMMKGMIGANGVALPGTIVEHLGSTGLQIKSTPYTAYNFMSLAAWIAAALFVALAFPNTLEILAGHEPALGVRPDAKQSAFAAAITWRPSLAWTCGMSVMAFIAILSLGGPSAFLYWQF